MNDDKLWQTVITGNYFKPIADVGKKKWHMVIFTFCDANASVTYPIIIIIK